MDPFNIYPWDNLCHDYQDLARNEKCKTEAVRENKNQGTTEKTEDKDTTEKTEGRMNVYEAVPQKFSLSRNIEVDLDNIEEDEDKFSVTQSRNDLGQFSITREKK